jgi:hypothetical protein
MSNGLLNSAHFLSSRKDILPFDLNEKCVNQFNFPNQPCFQTGDNRANQNSLLIVFHTIWLRGMKLDDKKLLFFIYLF